MKNEKRKFLETFFAAAKYPPDAALFSDFLGEKIDQKYPPKNPDDEFWRQKYLKKAKFWLPILRFFPGILGVAVCNSLAFGGGGKNSDIDLFVIAKKNRLWTARVFSTLFFHFLKLRRHGKKIAGRFCFSFFIDETALDFSKIAITPRDPYLAFWISAILPIFGREIFQKFAAKNRDFVKKNTPIKIRFEKNLSKIPKISPRFRPFFEKKINFFSKIWGEKISFGDAVELFLKTIFLPRTQKKAEKLPDKSGTILSENILKFHNSDRRAFFAEKMKVFFDEKISF